MDEAERCTELGFINAGRLIANGSPQSLKDRLAGKVIDLQVQPAIVAQEALGQIEGVGEVRLRGGKVRLSTNDPLRLIQKLRRQWPDRALRWTGWKLAEPDMDDVFEAFRTGLLKESPSTEPNVNYENFRIRETYNAA
jgi:ABC-2 type transport system ATP-binding protein